MKNRIIIASVAVIALAGILATVGCAPQANGESEGGNATMPEPNGSQATVAWSPDSDCSACHEKEADSAGETGCLAQAHAQEGYACSDCHVDEQALSAAHEQSASSSPASKLKETDVSDEACLACHESRETVAAETTDVVLTDDRGTAVNPHDLAPSPDHDALVCTDCHVSHEATPAIEEAQSTCASCHHAGVFECGTCHT